VQVVRHGTAAEFLARSRVWLERAEVENNLILGISRYFEANPERTHVNPYLLTVEERDTLLGAALMTPPRHLIITGMLGPALTALTDYFLRGGISISGVVGPTEAARLFAEYWKSQTGKNHALKMSQRLYACKRVLVRTYSHGRLRPAIVSDEPLATQWIAEFCREAGIEDEIASMTASPNPE